MKGDFRKIIRSSEGDTMETIRKIIITEIIGDGICVSSEDGEAVYNELHPALNGGPVILSFEGVEVMTSAFLNAAVGRLYKDHSAEKIDSCLRTEYSDSFHGYLLERVKRNAIAYYADPEKFRKSLQGILDDE